MNPGHMHDVRTWFISPCAVSKAKHARQLVGGTNTAASFYVSRERKMQDEKFSTRLKKDDRNNQGGKCIAPRLGMHLSEQAKTCLSRQERNSPPFRKKNRNEHYSQVIDCMEKKKRKGVPKYQFIYSSSKESLNRWHHQDSKFVQIQLFPTYVSDWISSDNLAILIQILWVYIRSTMYSHLGFPKKGPHGQLTDIFSERGLHTIPQKHSENFSHYVALFNCYSSSQTIPSTFHKFDKSTSRSLNGQWQTYPLNH